MELLRRLSAGWAGFHVAKTSTGACRRDRCPRIRWKLRTRGPGPRRAGGGRPRYPPEGAGRTVWRRTRTERGRRDRNRTAALAGTPEVAAGIIHLSPRPADGSIAPRLEVRATQNATPPASGDARSRHNPDEPRAAPARTSRPLTPSPPVPPPRSTGMTTYDDDDDGWTISGESTCWAGLSGRIRRRRRAGARTAR